jgi:hypothetical protein
MMMTMADATKEQLAFEFAPLPTLQQRWTPDDIYASCSAETSGRLAKES